MPGTGWLGLIASVVMTLVPETHERVRALRRYLGRVHGSASRSVLTVVVVLVVAVGGSYIALSSSSGQSTKGTSSSKSGLRTGAITIPAIEAGILPWTLQAPISREVVLGGSGSQVELVGGLEQNGTSSAGVFNLDTSTGALTYQTQLPVGVHDASGAEISGNYFIFGGGSPNTVNSDYELSSGGQSTSSSVLSPLAATSVGTIPQPRSDSVAVSVNGRVFVVGGYDGTNPDSQVLVTSDGKNFSNFTNLAVPVRYPAVASSGSSIYVFGGQLVGGTSNGQPTSQIQRIDLATRKVQVVGNLPYPLQGASAFDLGGNIYVAGGSSSATPTSSQTSSGCSICVAQTVAGQTTETAIYAFDSQNNTVENAGTLAKPVAFGGSVVVNGRGWIVGGEVNGTEVSYVQMLEPNQSFGVAGQAGAGSPYFGDKLLVADRGANELLVMDDAGNVTWQYPSPTLPAPPGTFYFPDDAFFINHGTAILSNQEQNETIIEIGYPSGKIIWSFGHAGQKGAAPGYLYEPDDAYLLKNGQITVADAYNCRILFINPNGTVASQIGTNGVCQHSPPTDIGTPNGDTPLQNGNVLVSEINGSWVTEYTPQGGLVFTVQLPISYPSDPQQLGANSYLISDYASPGAILEFNQQGTVTYRYQPKTGTGELNHPSLTEMLPSGVFMANDDYNDRIVAIDPVTQALVWQYGTTGVSGTTPGLLNTPDGFDILQPNGSTPTHPYTG